MAQSSVQLIVDASKALTPLKQTEQATRKLEGAVRDANGRLRDAKGRFIGMGAGAQQAKKGVDGLAGALGKLGAAISVIGIGKFVFFKTAELQTQTRSLKVLTGSLETAKGIIAELQEFGNVTPFTSAELIETAKRLKAFGFETEKIVEVTKRLSDIAGATGADLGGIATAFGQIQAKGRLQGEELLQLQERGVDLQGTLREAYGLTAEEFQKALAAGRIGADAVNFALEKLTETGGKYAEGAFAQSDTLSGKLSTLQDNVDNLARVFGETMAPALASIIDDITAMVNTFVKGLQYMQTAYNDFMRSLRSTTITDVQKDIKGLNDRIANQQRQLSLVNEAAPGGVGAAKGFRETIAQLRSMRTDLEAELARLTGTTLFIPKAITFKAQGAGDRDAPPALGADTQPKGKGKGRTRESRIPQLERELGLIRSQEALQARIAEAEIVKNQGEVIRLNGIQRGVELLHEAAAIQASDVPQAEKKLQLAAVEEKLNQSKYQTLKELAALDLQQRQTGIDRLQDLNDEQELLQARLNGNEAEVILKQQIRDIMKDTKGLSEADVKNKLESINATRKQIADAERLEQIYGQLGQTIASGVTDMLTAAMDKTKSLAEVASNMLRNLANQLLQVAVNTALFSLFPGSSLFKSLPRFADGGSISGGKPAIVGERGPELFMPGRSGSIIPNNALGGNITVNVDATGTQVQGDAPNANKLGEALGAAVRAELLRQKRPGGLLA